MSSLITMPMSFAGLTYGFFAIQQDIPLSELEPIRFEINSNPVSLDGGSEYLGTDKVSTYIQGDQKLHSEALKIGPPDPTSPTGFSSGLVVDSKMPETRPFTGVDDGIEGINSNEIAPFSSTGIFISDISGAGQNHYVQMPEDIALEEAQNIAEPKEETIKSGIPRASIQIGLLNELSFLDN